MVDPNPGRGMPAQLQRYWLAGKGAAKIRWGQKNDFYRCVRQLRKYFPDEPEGLCNILHQKAVGAAPGKGHAHAITAASRALFAMQPKLGDLWWGPIAPINRPTGEPRRSRVFEPGALDHRSLPLPLRWQKTSTDGHGGAVTVARILGITYGPDEKGQDWAFAYGDWLDENTVPEVKEARYLNDQGVLGPSVDPGGQVIAQLNPETGAEHMMRYTIGGATLVPIPAFTGLRLMTIPDDDEYDFDDEDMTAALTDESDCGCGGSSYGAEIQADDTFSVNPDGWKGLPLAGRASTFDNDDAVLRIGAWAGVGTGNVDQAKLRRAFLWHDPQQSPTITQSYRLPVGDIINGQLTLVYHAIYAAAALLSGAHGGLPNIPEQDKSQLRGVITGIYETLAREFNDGSIQAPWVDQGASMTEYTMTGDGFPVTPPKAWFANPGLTAKTPLTVTADGRVFGHLAAWNECHRDVGARECVLAPRSRKNYAPFHLGQVMTAEGDTISVGKIVMDTRHAGISLGYNAAAIHYDNTGDEVAVVRAGEDEHGIWVAGAVVPEADRRKVAKLRRSPLSGDWRAVDGNLELTAALAVNVPAFPVYAMDDDQRTALVAAGTVYPDPVDEGDKGMMAIQDWSAAERETLDVWENELSAEQDDRRWALLEILDEEEQIQQRERAQKLAKLFAAGSTDGTGKSPSQDPPAVATGSSAAPTVPATGAAPTDDQAMAARQMDSQFVILEDPAEDPANDNPTPDTPPEAPTNAEPAPAPS